MRTVPLPQWLIRQNHMIPCLHVKTHAKLVSGRWVYSRQDFWYLLPRETFFASKEMSNENTSKKFNRIASSALFGGRSQETLQNWNSSCQPSSAKHSVEYERIEVAIEKSSKSGLVGSRNLLTRSNSRLSWHISSYHLVMESRADARQ